MGWQDLNYATKGFLIGFLASIVITIIMVFYIQFYNLCVAYSSCQSIFDTITISFAFFGSIGMLVGMAAGFITDYKNTTKNVPGVELESE